LPYIYELAEDQYGNYVVQKIIENSPEKIPLIFKQIETKSYSLGIDMYGCRVLQKMIELSDDALRRKMLNELVNDLKECILNKNGNHVVQKFITTLAQGQYKEIIKVVEENSIEVAVSQFGCRVIQRIIEKGSEEEKDCIQKNLSGRYLDLIYDQFGNYVIQHLVERRGPLISKDIYTSIKGAIFDMCMHKFASNVIEKCLKHGSEKQCLDIVSEIYSEDGNDKLMPLVNDKFGNYCIQKMIEHSPKSYQIKLIRKILYFPVKAGDGYLKHIIDFIEKRKGYPKQDQSEYKKIFS